MRVLSRVRQAGKTHESAEWVAADPNRVLLVIHEAERGRVIREYGLDPKQVMVAAGAPQRLMGQRRGPIGVDNIDLLGWRTVLELGQSMPLIEWVTETR